MNDERIVDALGPDVAIWTLEAGTPHNDVMRRTADLAEHAR